MLTAAHCWYALHQPTVTRVEIRVGSLDNRYARDAAHPDGYLAYTLTSNAYYWPSDFNPDMQVSDIMLIRLAQSVPVSVQKPAKWNAFVAPLGSLSQVNGWGWVCDGPDGLDCSTWYKGPLQRLNLEKISDASCATLHDPRNSCHISAARTPANACLGDSGAGNFVKVGLNSDMYVREVIVGDGDRNFDSCAYGPDGTLGLALATEVGSYARWMGGVMTSSATTARALMAPPRPADPARVLRMAG